MPSSAADFAEHDGLHDELRHDVALLRADRAADADLAGALGDGDEHDVHDADARGEQRDGADEREADAHGEGDLLELLDHRVAGEDLEVVLLAGRDFADGAQEAARLLHGVVETRGVFAPARGSTITSRQRP